jgi:hypothetical protein
MADGHPAEARALPVQRAQLVWRRAVTLSATTGYDDHSAVVLDLLQTADQGLTTMRHALALGWTHQRSDPGDVPTRDAIDLLVRTIAWLGQRSEPGEIGTAMSGSTWGTAQIASSAG